MTVAEAAAFWKAHKTRDSHVHTNADIACLHGGSHTVTQADSPPLGHHGSQQSLPTSPAKLPLGRSVDGLRGEDLLNWRHFICLSLIATLPTSLVGDDTGAAILRSSGVVLLNGNPVPSASTLLSGDLVETQKQSLARIELSGSAVDISAETVVRFDADEFILEHGSLSVNTSRGLKVRAGCLTVTPVQIEWTHYEVRDVDGRVTVSALKDDVYIEVRSANWQQAKQSARSDRVIVREGEQKTSDEKCGSPLKQSTPLAGKGALMNSPWVQGTGAGVVIGVACWVFCFPPESISPDRPDHP